MYYPLLAKGAFDEFKNRWLPPVPLVYPRSACFFFNVRPVVKMKQSSKTASRLKNQSASAASTTASTAGGFTILKSFEYILETSTITAR